MGSHNELLEKGSLYKKLYEMQFKTGAMEMAEPTLKK
jgi:hypothetical protein